MIVSILITLGSALVTIGVCGIIYHLGHQSGQIKAWQRSNAMRMDAHRPAFIAWHEEINQRDREIERLTTKVNENVALNDYEAMAAMLNSAGIDHDHEETDSGSEIECHVGFASCVFKFDHSGNLTK